MWLWYNYTCHPEFDEGFTMTLCLPKSPSSPEQDLQA